MSESRPSRRRFLARIVAVLNAAVTTLLAVPAVGYVLSPVLRRRSSQWVAIGGASTFVSRIPQRITYDYRDEGGYAVAQTRRVAFVVPDDEGKPIVLSPVCTHMGCNVAFNKATHLFECPCHGGKYDASGQVVGGPPPRPLRRLKTRVRDGSLEIQVT